MKTTRRGFLQTSVAATAAGLLPKRSFGSDKDPELRAEEIAKRHRIVRDVPGPSFFEGMLLGNGDVGVVAEVRPNSLGLHLGKSDVWNIRVSEGIEPYILPWKDILKLWKRASETALKEGQSDMLYIENRVGFFGQYTERVNRSYSRPWPHPWHCGSIWFQWDPRWVRTGRQVLDPSNGLFTVELGVHEWNQRRRTVTLSTFVDRATGLISVLTDGPVPLMSVRYYSQIDRTNKPFAPIPPPEIEAKSEDGFAEFSCFQYFPAIGPTEEMPDPPKSDKDRNFSLCGRVDGSWAVKALKEDWVYLKPRSSQILRMDLIMATPRDILLDKLEHAAAVAHENHPWIMISQNRSYNKEELDTMSHARNSLMRMAEVPVSKIQQDSEARWHDFWSHSAVEIEDSDLEKIWYHNQYFLACCLRERKTAPGLFGNWNAGNIARAWHSDYHMDYNQEQIYWGVFSSNHVEQHLPYVELCQNLTPMCEKFAQENFEMPGAVFPVSAYPVPSQMIAYPVPPWAYQFSMTPWTVQSLWWHYLYTQDVDYLRKVYPMLRAAARFIAAYVKKGSDGKYHVIPTVSSENWGFTVDYRLNKDCILDLSLIAFLMDAMVKGSSLLKTDETERSRWAEIRDHLAPYPKGKESYGEVWLDVRNAPLEHVYNVPITLAPVFPGEQVGLGRGEDHLEIARRTAEVIRLEGGNDLVFQPLIRARLGMLDLKWFKEQVQYCILPNGADNDRIRQTGGRYDFPGNFDFMMHDGIWTENFALPAVLNECMMQSYTETIRLFPNTWNLGPARFRNLRAAGAFLVSARFDGKKISGISLLSEKGKTVRILNPWNDTPTTVTRQRDGREVAVKVEDGVLIFSTSAGETYHLLPHHAL